MSAESGAQEFVYSLERGRWGMRLIYLLIIAFAAFQSVAHVLLNPMNKAGGYASIFVGLTHPKGMEQAVIARELVRGNGFSTTVIKPAAIALVEKNKGSDGFTSFLAPDGPTRGNIPDYYHAPLNPWINSIVLRAAVGITDRFQMRTDANGQSDFWRLKPGETIHPADRVIAGVGVAFFLAAVGMTFLTTRRIFNERLALFTVVLLLVCNQFWTFVSSGLPQMLMLFLFSAATYFIVRALAARENGGSTWPWHTAAGLAFGLLALAHPLTSFVFFGALIYVAISFVPRGRAPLIMLVAFLACMSPWLVRNARVCGSPFGISGQTRLHGLQGTESRIMRTLLTSDKLSPAIDLRVKVQTGLLSQLDSLVGRLGMVIAAPVFFLGLLHSYKKRETRSFRWGLMSMFLFGVLGMAIFGFADGFGNAELQSNDIYPMFIPLLTAYGLAIILAKWNRMQFRGWELAGIREVNFTFQALFILVSAFPLLSNYMDPPRTPYVWPPNNPPALGELNAWYAKDDIICSDMPWAVSWYADRKSLWLPLSIVDFNYLNEFRFQSKVTGLLLTPITGNRGLLNEVEVGEFRDWRGFILRNARAEEGFPLPAAHPITVHGAANYILFADRDRWTARDD